MSDVERSNVMVGGAGAVGSDEKRRVVPRESAPVLHENRGRPRMRGTTGRAEQTHERILDAALKTLRRDGVSSATLEEIAKAAGVTRGAVYWHFENWKALFHALRARVSLPLVDQTDFALLHDSDTADPLTRIEHFLVGLLELLQINTTTRDTLDMMMNCCEYVGDLARELEGFTCRIEEVRENLQQTYEEAQRKLIVPSDLAAPVAAIETTMLIVGMIRLWSLADETSPMRARAREVISQHIAGRRRIAGVQELCSN